MPDRGQDADGAGDGEGTQVKRRRWSGRRHTSHGVKKTGEYRRLLDMMLLLLAASSDTAAGIVDVDVCGCSYSTFAARVVAVVAILLTLVLASHVHHSCLSRLMNQSFNLFSCRFPAPDREQPALVLYLMIVT